MSEQPDTQKKQDTGAAPARGRRSTRKNPRRETGRRARPEFDHRVIDVRRVTRVVAGGRRFSFSVTLVAGNRKGSVAVGLGKAADTQTAVEKALVDAKKSMREVARTAEHSIARPVSAKYGSAVVELFPAPGTGGVTAGGAVRIVLELAGVKDVGAKILSRSKNKINNARAALAALKKLSRQTARAAQ